jgi:hypothetical protein
MAHEQKGTDTAGETPVSYMESEAMHIPGQTRSTRAKSRICVHLQWFPLPARVKNFQSAGKNYRGSASLMKFRVKPSLKRHRFNRCVIIREPSMAVRLCRIYQQVGHRKLHLLRTDVRVRPVRMRALRPLLRRDSDLIL